jgi:hypothetical protein
VDWAPLRALSFTPDSNLLRAVTKRGDLLQWPLWTTPISLFTEGQLADIRGYEVQAGDHGIQREVHGRCVDSSDDPGGTANDYKWFYLKAVVGLQGRFDIQIADDSPFQPSSADVELNSDA